MNDLLVDLLFWTHLGSTLYMVGLIWFVQVVHYPLFAYVGSAEFQAYEKYHTGWITWVVGPPMLLEGITACGLTWFGPPELMTWSWWTSLTLLAVVWLSTAAIQMPFHKRLARGLDDDTLVIWTTEFGRTPFAQGSLGRDHNGGSFVTWLWGAGIKAGTAHGRSDDWGYKAVENPTWCYDLHATILHLLGIDHTRLTVRQNGIDRRLTDVHGHVVNEILA